MSRLRSNSGRVAALGLGLLLGPPCVGMSEAVNHPVQPWSVTSPPGSVTGDPDAMLARQDIGLPPSGDFRPGLDNRPLMPGTNLTREEILRIDAELLENILRIEDPGERSLALVNAARYKIQTRDLDTARRALEQASISAGQVAEPLRRDLRLIATSRAYVELAQEDINTAVSGVAGILSLEPELSVEDRVNYLDKALESFDRSADLAFQIAHIGYGPQTQFFVAEQQAQGGQSIGLVAFRNPGPLVEQEGLVPRLQGLAARYIEQAAQHAASIRTPVWRDTALAVVSASAATSNQFDLSRRIARSIPGLELRFEALLSVAEAEARRGSPEQATIDYADAARTLSSLPIADLRGTLNDVLIESLIAAGRFPDARRCIVLYADDVDRMEALGAVAQAMGSRGLSDEAREWILREVAPDNRSGLYRRVNDGVLGTLERYGNSSYNSDRPF